MNSLDDCPDLLTVKEVAEILRLKENTIYRLQGLRKTRIGNGRGMIRYRKKDLISYINAGASEEVKNDAHQKTQRHRKVGLPTLLRWEELQAV